MATGVRAGVQIIGLSIQNVAAAVAPATESNVPNVDHDGNHVTAHLIY